MLTTSVFAEETSPEASTESEAPSLSETQSAAITTHCDALKRDLQKVQKDDSHARVYLGGHFETINSKFVIPLNTRLVENTLSTPELVNNQNDLTKAKATFVSDFIDYQKELETLVNIDCKAEPAQFYKTLEKARAKRKTVASDVTKIRQLLKTHETTIITLKDTL